MMINFNLNASLFKYSQIRRNSYFEMILVKCIDVYKVIINSAVQLSNDENKIRDEFLKYLQNLDFKKKYDLKHLKFDEETKENAGRADIRILPTKDEYVNDDAYYIIECKRLDSRNTSGTTGLNAEYVKNGICRFASDYYTSYYSCNAMFGFIVEPVDVQIDIVDNINSMLDIDYVNAQKVNVNANIIQQMRYEDFANKYPYSYISKHKCNSGKELSLYHLMFDFSQNIQ